MKKIILTISALVLIPIALLAQIKNQVKKTVKNTSATIEKPIINTEEQVKKNAEKWFKELYVDKFFKDPYSYKLLKITSAKISVKQSLIDSLEFLDGEIEKCNISKNERTLTSRKQCQDAYDKAMVNMKKDEYRLKEEKETNQIDYLNKRITLHKNYAIDLLKMLKDYDMYFLAVNEKTRIQEKLSTITPSHEASLAFFKIKIDCYSKNSIGNEVLGRFQFPYTDKGHIGSGNGFDTVVQLNKTD